MTYEMKSTIKKYAQKEEKPKNKRHEERLRFDTSLVMVVRNRQCKYLKSYQKECADEQVDYYTELVHDGRKTYQLVLDVRDEFESRTRTITVDDRVDKTA